MKIKHKRSQVNAKFAQAFKAAFDEFNRANEEVITEPRQWGNFGVTHRRNGQIVVGGYRNIVDLSNLRSSQSQELLAPNKGRVTWNGDGETPVALVHEGYTTVLGKRVPARRWTRVAAQEGAMVEEFVSKFRGR